MTIYRFAQFRYNTDNRELISAQQSKRLRRKVADVLAYLLSHQQEVVSKEELLNDIWQHGEYRENSLVHCIRELRKHLEDSAQHPVFIDTVPQKGYCWIYREVTEQDNDVALAAEAAAEADETATAPIAADDIPTPEDIFKPTPPAELMISEVASAEVAEPTAAPVITPATPVPSKTSQYGLKAVGFILGLVILVGLASVWQHSQNNTQEIAQTTEAGAKVKQPLSIAVMPFINATGLAEYQWLELGLSDMFGIGLRQSTSWQVIPSSHVQSMLADLNITLWTSEAGKAPSYPLPSTVREQVQIFLNASKADLVISATIEKDTESAGSSNLKFNYQLHDKLGIRHESSISYPNLPSSVPTLVSRIANQLDPTFKKSSNHWHLAKDPQAGQDFANGLQALQGKGAPLAKRYFEAALLNDPDYYPAAAYLAYSLSLVGQWQESVKQYRQVLKHPAINKDPYFHSFVLNSLGDLLRQQYKLDEAEKLLTKALSLTDKQQLRYRRVDILRNISALRNAQGNSKERHRLLAEAEQLSQPFVDVNMLADNLYYLGSPANTGLEVDPDINMAANQQKLNRALSYYKKINDLHGQAKTYLAIGTNYIYELNTRQEAMAKASSLFEQLDDSSGLIDTLSYLGYFYIQLHMGDKAEKFLIQATKLAFELQDPWRQANTQYLLAFATLDQGLAQTGNSGQAKLEQAVVLFDQVHEAYLPFPDAQNAADSYLLQAWGYTELERFEKAKSVLNQSMARLDGENNPVTLIYNQMAMMDVLIRQQDWAAALAVTDDANGHYQLLSYQARAHFELGHNDQAVALMQQNQTVNADKWGDSDQQKLDYYLATASGKLASILGITLASEASANATYCESLWNLSVEDLGGLSSYNE